MYRPDEVKLHQFPVTSIVFYGEFFHCTVEGSIEKQKKFFFHILNEIL